MSGPVPARDGSRPKAVAARDGSRPKAVAAGDGSRPKAVAAGDGSRPKAAGSVVIVSGCPGSGKTSLSAALAKASPRGFHLVSDHYYELVAHPILPTLPESRVQNESIMRALGASSAELARSGYDVFLDGVVGPWMLPQLRPFLAPFPTHYAVLQVAEPLALERVHGRDGPGRSPIVRHMHRQLSALGPFARHAVETEGLDRARLALDVGERLSGDQLRLDWSQVELQRG